MKTARLPRKFLRATPVGPNAPAYVYEVDVDRAIDGDTIRGFFRLGLGCSIERDIRMLGYNTPEIVGAERAEGLEAKAELAAILEGKRVIVETYKDRKSFDRYLAMVYLNGRNVNAYMMTKYPGMAYRVKFVGGGEVEIDYKKTA